MEIGNNNLNKLNILASQKEPLISHSVFKEKNNFDKKYFVSFGPPGAGKTTTLQKIHSMEKGYSHFYDDILNPSLNFKNYLHYAFIDNKREFFFNFQIEVLQTRFWQSFNAPENSIVDESIFSILAYSQTLYSLGWFSEYMYETFFRNYITYEAILVPPVKIFYFYCDTTTLLDRLKKRGRFHEKYYPIKYVDKLNEEFQNIATFLKRYHYDIEYIDTQYLSPSEIANDICKILETT